MIPLPVNEPTHVAAARRAALELAQRLGFGETDAGRVAIVVTEMATNLVRHAADGEILLGGDAEDGPAIEILALDRGPGLADVAASMRDGFSTAGGPGTGLGAISRLAALFDVHSAPGAGTGLLARLTPAAAPGASPSPLSVVQSSLVEYGAVCVPKPGEQRCGDAWTAAPRADGAAILVVDGLGHGEAAAQAAQAAVGLFRERAALAPAAMVAALHEGLRSTRGVAAAVAEVDVARQVVRFAGLGNISGSVVAAGTVGRMVSQNGIAGHQARRITEFTYPWSREALLVLHSDGLRADWALDRYPGLAARHPGLVAGVLYRDWSRRRDDVVVVVARERSIGSAA